MKLVKSKWVVTPGVYYRQNIFYAAIDGFHTPWIIDKFFLFMSAEEYTG